MELTYTIRIEAFEGPFDLLLFFIERDELDIYDIPIAKIADDFLGYVHTMENLNIDMASEFILVAATLMRIKAKMLIPRKEVDEQGNEIDPREELIQRLIEYKSYKEVTEELRRKEESRSMSFPRGNVQVELAALAEEALADAELESLTTVLENPQRYLHVETKCLRLSPMNVVIDAASTDAAADVDFGLAGLRGSPPMRRAFVLARVARSELPPPKKINFDDAMRYL